MESSLSLYSWGLSLCALAPKSISLAFSLEHGVFFLSVVVPVPVPTTPRPPRFSVAQLHPPEPSSIEGIRGEKRRSEAAFPNPNTLHATLAPFSSFLGDWSQFSLRLLSFPPPLYSFMTWTGFRAGQQRKKRKGAGNSPSQTFTLSSLQKPLLFQ